MGLCRIQMKQVAVCVYVCTLSHASLFVAEPIRAARHILRYRRPTQEVPHKDQVYIAILEDQVQTIGHAHCWF